MKYNLEELHQAGKINDYFFSKLKNSIMLDAIDQEDFEDFLADVMQMSSIGISSPDEEMRMRRIQHDVPDIIEDISAEQVGPEIMDALYRELYSDKYDLTDIYDVFCTVARAARAVGIILSDEAEECNNLNKIAYPQGYAGDHQKPAYDISRWIKATRDIHSRMNRAKKPYYQAISEVTAKWDKMEKLDYKHWLKFYDEGVDKKYPKIATASDYHGDNGYILPMSQLPVPMREKEEHKPKIDKVQVRDSIEMHRNKILGRLSAAERLLCSLDGQSFAGDDQEFMLKLLQDLKRKVQIANKISIKSALFEDYIFRAGNYMKEAHASLRGRDFFHKIAQFDPFAGATPPAGGSIGAPAVAGISEDEAWARFFARYEDGLYDENDKEKFEESQRKVNSPAAAVAPAPGTPAPKPAPKPKAASDEPDIVVTAQNFGAPDEDISIGEAEVAPPQDKPRRQRDALPPVRLPPENDIVVTEDESVGPEDNTADIIDEALNQVTIHDAINLLEMLVGIYKQREVPRQLSKLDMVMDSLGLAAYFPQLGEAQSKALESTQYVSTRLEDMLAKLKGSIESSEADSWVKKEKEIDPETQAVQSNLQSQQDKEDQRKSVRKQRSNEKLDKGDAKEKSEVARQAQQELAQPTPVETGKIVPVR